MRQLSFMVVIPARYGSSRLPGKPLLMLAGVPMVVHVLARAAEAGPNRVVVATDDARIQRAVEDAGGHAVMTSPDHVSGTDRLAEVCDQLGLDDEQVIVNLQGDEPLMPGALVRAVAAALVEDEHAALATLAVQIHDPSELFNPNAVKVTLDRRGRALYFSRAPIPWVRGSYARGAEPRDLPVGVPIYRHLGLYAYRARTLRALTALPASPLETAESLEQLRALENGLAIRVLLCEGAAPPPGVDTDADIAAADAALRVLARPNHP